MIQHGKINRISSNRTKNAAKNRIEKIHNIKDSNDLIKKMQNAYQYGTQEKVGQRCRIIGATKALGGFGAGQAEKSPLRRFLAAFPQVGVR